MCGAVNPVFMLIVNREDLCIFQSHFYYVLITEVLRRFSWIGIKYKDVHGVQVYSKCGSMSRKIFWRNTMAENVDHLPHYKDESGIEYD